MSEIDPRLQKFVNSFVIIIIVEFIILWLTDLVFGKSDFGYYQFIIPGLFFVALIIALVGSLK
jgi:hypothetical protein